MEVNKFFTVELSVCSLLDWSKAGSTSWPRSSRIDSNSAKRRFLYVDLGAFPFLVLAKQFKAKISPLYIFSERQQCHENFCRWDCKWNHRGWFEKLLLCLWNGNSILLYTSTCWNELEVCKIVTPSLYSVYSFSLFLITWFDWIPPHPPNWTLVLNYPGNIWSTASLGKNFNKVHKWN